MLNGTQIKARDYAFRRQPHPTHTQLHTQIWIGKIEICLKVSLSDTNLHLSQC